MLEDIHLFQQGAALGHAAHAGELASLVEEQLTASGTPGKLSMPLPRISIRLLNTASRPSTSAEVQHAPAAHPARCGDVSA